MNIGILHLTDIHFSETTNLGGKTLALANVLSNDLYDVEKIFIVISGDIANTGARNEYSKAKLFIAALEKIFLDKHPNKSIRYVMVPGNHDCDFSLDSDLRKTVISNINYDTLGSDNSVMDLCLGVQKDFWGFFGFYNALPSNKLSYIIKDKVGEFNIDFHCFNTAWMSTKKEMPGHLFFPVKKTIRKTDQKETKNNISIGVWHHPINWFTPNTKENNKKEFQNLIEATAPIHLFGHEHENEYYHNSNKITNEETRLFAGKVFNDNGVSKLSGFQILKIDLSNLQSKIKAYSWVDEHFSFLYEDIFSINKEKRKYFNIAIDFAKDLDDIKIPRLFDKKDIKLSDIFVFQDMESNRTANVDSLETHIDSSRLLESDIRYCVLDGESQVGKSALLSIYFLKFYGAGLCPIFLKGEDIKDLQLEKSLKRAFSKQYENGVKEYDRYMQSDINERVLLIDDYNYTSLNSSSTKLLLEEARAKFGKVIITADSTSTLLQNMQSELPEWRFFSLKPLGYRKRNDLIEGFHYAKENPLTIDEENIIQVINSSFDNVQAILGNKLMPSFPVFILSILQALEYKPSQLLETSFGYCYQTLIHYSLNSAGVSHDNIDTYFNFLTELAYYYVSGSLDFTSKDDLEAFYLKYKQDYNVPSYDILYKNLIKSKIIAAKDGAIKFGYKYILYYLSAKKISDIIHKEEGKKIVNSLFEDVHNEQNANILVFITHHSKDISFIEDSLINSMIVLDNMEPITLEKKDKFYSVIQGLAEQVKSNVLEINKNPREERKKFLKLEDENEREMETVDKNEEVNSETEALFVPFQKSLRFIDIIGQIIRNRKGSLTKSQLHEMTKEIYTTAFRTVSFVSDILNSTKDQIIATIVDESEENESGVKISERISVMVQMTCLQACLSIFNKLTFSVGNRDLREMYKNVADDINTPAAKLVSFGINSYYGNISIDEMIKLNNEFKGNAVAINLLRARVKSYVYNKKIDFKTKQQIASALGMHVTPNSNPNIMPNNYRGKNRD